MALVLIEHIVDELNLGPPHDVVVLPALPQIDLRTVMTGTVADRPTGILQGEGRRLIGLGPYRVEEVHLLAMANLQPRTTILPLETWTGRSCLRSSAATSSNAGMTRCSMKPVTSIFNGLCASRRRRARQSSLVPGKIRASRRIERLAASRCMAFSSPQHIKIMTIENGNALAMVAACNDSSPPATSNAIARPPTSSAQKIRCQTGDSSSPFEVSMSITKAPESAEVTKNSATRMTASEEVSMVSGRCSRNSKSAIELSVETACTNCWMPSARTMCNAVLP